MSLRFFEKTTARASGLLGRLKARLPKTRLGKVLLGAAAVFFSASLFVQVWSGRPSFCKSCHLIKPHYQSWATSVHGKENVNCTQCHFEPGVVPYIRGKMNGLLEVVKYVSGGYPTKLRPVVSDASCLREGCHSKEELREKPVEFGGIDFVHGKHFDEPLRGVRLRCATCHSTSLHSKNGTVSGRVCFTCHFKPGGADETESEREAREKLGNCDECHDVPGEVVTRSGARLDHGKYAASGRDCSRCHAHLTRGDGRVLRERCRSCHHEGTGHLEKFAETELMHESHVTRHQVACFECHSDISHGKKALPALEGGPCGSCHAGFHADVQKLYEGKGGAGVEDLPSPMFASGVQCTGCHVSVENIEASGGDHGAPGKSCVDCHGKGYDRLASRWKTAFDIYTTRLEDLLKKARSGGAATPRAGELLRRAAANIELVRRGAGVHNVRYAARCLRQAQAGLAEVLAPAGLKDAAAVLPSYEKDAASCLEMCHLGVETVAPFEYAKRMFPHGRHVVSPNVNCSQCHSFDEERHGETFSKRVSNCAACHHEEEENCSSCHAVQSAVYFGKVEGDPRSKPGAMAREGVACEACHAGISEGHSLEKIRGLCIECHDDKKAFGRMLDGWRAGIGEELEEVERLLGRAEEILKEAGLSEKVAEALRRACAAAREGAEIVRRDGSLGAHNLDYLDEVLSEAAEGLRDAMRAAKK